MRPSYGKLVIVRELTKAEARDLERQLSKEDLTRWVTLDGWHMRATDVQVGEVNGNVQYLTVRATV